MADYIFYADSCGIKQKDMVEVIKQKWPFFVKEQMSLACNPERNALMLIPAAEDMLVEKFGKGPGLGISPKLRKHSHENKNKPCRLCVRVSNDLRSRVQKVYEQMCFATMQDLLEAAVAEFVQRHEIG